MCFSQSAMLMLTDSTLFFMNLTSNFRNNPKFNLTGRVNGWITNVTDPVNPEENAPVAQKPHSITQSCSTPTSSSSAEIPPSTLFSQSQATSTSNATSLGLTDESSAVHKVPSYLSNMVGIHSGGKAVGRSLTASGSDELESAKEPVVLTQMASFSYTIAMRTLILT